jgi:hypothetical protein
MFPVSMAAQRDRLLGALARIVSDVDNVDALVPYLRGLGRDHRKFGTLAEHYGVVGASLLTTLAHFAGDAWTEEVAADWKAAYALVAQVMIGAAEQDEDSPRWWDATVIGHERRSMDISVLRDADMEIDRAVLPRRVRHREKPPGARAQLRLHRHRLARRVRQPLQRRHPLREHVHHLNMHVARRRSPRR